MASSGLAGAVSDFMSYATDSRVDRFRWIDNRGGSAQRRNMFGTGIQGRDHCLTAGQVRTDTCTHTAAIFVPYVVAYTVVSYIQSTKEHTIHHAIHIAGVKTAYVKGIDELMRAETHAAA